jgi:hypothetical protein
MKKNIILLLLLAGAALTTGCGSSDGSVLGIPQSNALDGGSTENGARSSNEAVKAYEFASDLQVQPLDSEQALVIPAGTQVSVLENIVVDGKELVRLGLEYSDATLDQPQDLWISAEEFAQADLSLVDDADPYDENGNETVSEFARKKMTYCYRYVKQYLLKHGMVNVYLPGGSAWMAAKELPKHGFTKTGRTPANAIVNDVCVYKGGPAGHGHIEIKLAQGWYYGYGYKKSPIKNRIFMGCFHK